MTETLQDVVDEVARAITRNAAQLEEAADAKDEGATPGPFGMAVALRDGRTITAGEARTPFPIQSISKVFALDLALQSIGDAVFKRVGREPSGDAFNSIVDLERNNGIPRNPFVNAGALVVVDILVEQLTDDRQASAVMDLIRGEIDGETITLDEGVLASEHEGGDLNRAMMSFARHHGNLNGSIDDVMEAYVHQCAISLDCRGLAKAGLCLADTRRDARDGSRNEKARRMRTLLGLMMTCGHYDASGDFAVRVGLPAKSGVGGGILAIVPDVASIAVWSPNLDQHGNSILGVHALEMLAERTGWSVFGPPVIDW